MIQRIRTHIGSIEGIGDTTVSARLREIKTIIDMITGRTPNRPQIKSLGPDATLAGVINKVNELIDQLQK